MEITNLPTVLEPLKPIISSDLCILDMNQLNELASFVEKQPRKMREAITKRCKTHLNFLSEAPKVEWWYKITNEIEQINTTVLETLRSMHANGGNKEQCFAITEILAQYQLQNVYKICNYVTKNWTGPAAIPPISFWHLSVTAVKKSVPIKKPAPQLQIAEISSQEAEEVQEMFKTLGESLGVPKYSKSTQQPHP